MISDCLHRGDLIYLFQWMSSRRFSACSSVASQVFGFPVLVSFVRAISLAALQTWFDTMPRALVLICRVTLLLWSVGFVTLATWWRNLRHFIRSLFLMQVESYVAGAHVSSTNSIFNIVRVLLIQMKPIPKSVQPPRLKDSICTAIWQQSMRATYNCSGQCLPKATPSKPGHYYLRLMGFVRRLVLAHFEYSGSCLWSAH